MGPQGSWALVHRTTCTTCMAATDTGGLATIVVGRETQSVVCSGAATVAVNADSSCSSKFVVVATRHACRRLPAAPLCTSLSSVASRCSIETAGRTELHCDVLAIPACSSLSLSTTVLQVTALTAISRSGRPDTGPRPEIKRTGLEKSKQVLVHRTTARNRKEIGKPGLQRSKQVLGLGDKTDFLVLTKGTAIQDEIRQETTAGKKKVRSFLQGTGN